MWPLFDLMREAANGNAACSMARIVARAAPERQASTLAKAREEAKAFVGKTLTNAFTHMTAIVSGNNLDKMLSESAARKSSSPEDHALAVANLDMLFENAVEGWSKRRDDDDPKNITAMRRMFAALLARDGNVRLVKLSVKELTHQGNRVYSVETIEVNEKSPVPEMVDADNRNGSSRTTGLTGLAESMADAVREFNRNLQKKTPSERPDGRAVSSPRQNAGKSNQRFVPFEAARSAGNFLPFSFQFLPFTDS